MRTIIIVCLLVYLCGIGTSFLFQLDKETYTLKQTKKIDSVYLNIKSKNSFERFKEICLNNLFIISINIVGALSLGGITLLNSFYNGFVFGYILKVSYSLNQDNIILKNIMPHFLEIVAIILSSIIGVFYGYKILCHVTDKHFNLVRNQKIIIFWLAPICILFIVLSAFTEAYVSME